MQIANKKTGRTYLDKNFTKEQLIDKILHQEIVLADLEEKNAKLHKDLAIALKTKETTQRKLDRLNTDDHIRKKILEYRARTMTPIAILETLKLDGVERVSLLQIKDIINSELNVEDKLFFEKCQAEYIESLKISTTLYKQSSIDSIQRLIDSAQEDLHNCEVEDVKARQSLRIEIGNYTEKRDKLIKNIDDTGNITMQDTMTSATVEEFKNRSKQYIKIATNNIKKIEGGGA